MNKMVWESSKQPLRQGLLFLYALIINKLFDFILASVGFEFTQDQKLQILSWGVPIVWSILSFVDNLMHRLGKKKEDAGTLKSPITSNLVTGITRF